MTIFFDESKSVDVSRISQDGWWIENTTEHVSKGTALGDDFTQNIYTPSENGLIARYDREADAWSDEIEDMSGKKFYSIYGQPFVIGVPDGEFPEGAITEEPPEYDPEKQTVLYEEEVWAVYDIKIGELYYDEFGVESIVSDFNFELPDGCTWIAPPITDKGFAVQLINGEWVQVKDNKGKVSYSIETKESVIIDYLGEVKEGYTLSAPSSIYDVWNIANEAWEVDIEAKAAAELEERKVKALETRYSEIYKDITYQDEVNGTHNYQLDTGKDGVKGIENIQEAYTLLASGTVQEADTRSWITSDNNSVLITYGDIKAIYLLYAMRKAEVYEQYQVWKVGDMSEPFEYVVQ